VNGLLKEALQEVLDGKMTEFLGAAPGERTETLLSIRDQMPIRPKLM